MRGHDQIINFRKLGFRPESVFLWDMPVQLSEPQWLEDFRFMEVSTYGDGTGSLDLRFLVGLPVTVIGEEIARVQAIANECKKVGADRVIASCGNRYAMWFKGEKKWLSF